MPIRFRCVACRQLLSIGRRKAGTEIQCPKCGRSQLVPSPEEAAAALAAEAAARTQTSPSTPTGIFIFDEDLEEESWTDSGSLVSSESGGGQMGAVGYASAPSPVGLSPAPSPQASLTSPTKEQIWISRRSLYLQALLIFLVGAGGFGLGYWLGRADNPARSSPPEPEKPMGPVFLEGRLFYRPEPLRVVPDEGAVAIFLPADRAPEERFITIGLRPQDPPPESSNPTIQAINRFGGAYARTSPEGSFLVQLPAPGQYYMLLISRHARRNQADVADQILQEMKKYFPEPKNLIDQAKFHWTSLTVRLGMPPIEHDFDR
ncbi:MAG: hypothetical protein NZ602_17040 [Thermoguttaceae bacterium]|nr:hypothetical protein [Thermoguttaceae bacterium]MDW8038583.1 hypothetical protein [Thermoguttaceae bacterium]